MIRIIGIMNRMIIPALSLNNKRYSFFTAEINLNILFWILDAGYWILDAGYFKNFTNFKNFKNFINLMTSSIP
jgi:hypothetical protein